GSGREVYLTSPDGHVRLIRARAAVRPEQLAPRVRELVTPFLARAPELDPFDEVRHNRWHIDRHATGRGMRGARPITIDVRADGRDAVWVALYDRDASPADRA